MSVEASLRQQAHSLKLLIHPKHRGQLEPMLISRALSLLAGLPGQGVRATVITDHTAAIRYWGTMASGNNEPWLTMSYRLAKRAWAMSNANGQTGQGQIAYRRLFANRNFLALWLGQMISFIGDYFYWLAVPIMVERLTNSALMVGLSSSPPPCRCCSWGRWRAFSSIAGIVSGR